MIPTSQHAISELAHKLSPHITTTAYSCSPGAGSFNFDVFQAVVDQPPPLAVGLQLFIRYPTVISQRLRHDTTPAILILPCVSDRFLLGQLDRGEQAIEGLRNYNIAWHPHTR
jgi:hypothetical protein